jgi:hypothetical protein
MGTAAALIQIAGELKVGRSFTLGSNVASREETSNVCREGRRGACVVANQVPGTARSFLIRVWTSR